MRLGPCTTVIFGGIVELGQSRTDVDFDHLGRTLAHLHIVLATHVLLNIARQVVAGYPYRIVRHDTAQRNHGDFGRTATYIYNHVALGSQHVETDTDGGSHRLVNHVDVAAAGMLRRVAHGTNLDFGTTRRDTYHHTQRGRKPVALRAYHLHHAANHLLGSVEVGNHTVAQGAYRAYVLMSLFIHQTSFFPDCQQLVGTLVQRNHRRLIDHNLVVVDNHRIGRTQVDGYLLRERKQSHIDYSFLMFNISV